MKCWFLFCLLGAALSAQDQPQPVAKPVRVQWEYSVVNACGAAHQAHAEIAGRSGWELVAVAKSDNKFGDCDRLYFKRLTDKPVEEPKPQADKKSKN